MGGWAIRDTCVVSDSELDLLAKQFKKEAVAHNFDSYLEVDGLRKILATWSVPPPMVRFLFRVFDKYARGMGDAHAL